MSYPTRPPYFAHRLVRLLTKTAAALEIGPEGCWLVSVIAFVEDAKQYSGPVKYFNETLAPVCGFASIGRLSRARDKAVNAGWLHYEPGGKGIAGVYWAEIPPRYRTIPDGATDETTDLPIVSLSILDRQTGDKREINDRQAIGKQQTFLPIPNPIPNPDEERAPTTAAKIPNADLLFRLIDTWNALPPDIVKPGNGARREPPGKEVIKGWRRVQNDTEAREPFSDLERLKDAIEKARFCHGRGWFSLPWMFGTNKNGEWNAVKLLKGGFDDDKHCRSKDISRGRIGPGQRFDPSATMPNDW